MIRLVLKIVLPVALLVGAGYGVFWMLTNRPTAKGRPAWTVKPVVEVQELTPTVRVLSVRSQGNVRPRLETTVVTQTSGRIVTLSENLRDGASFSEGEVLAQLEQDEYELAVASARAVIKQRQQQVAEQVLIAQRAESDIAGAKADVAHAELTVAQEVARAEQAQRDWDRMGRDGAPSDLVIRKPQLTAARATLEAAKARVAQRLLDLELAQARITTSKATVAVAEADLARRTLDLARTTIRAPYAGRVLEQLADMGRYMSPGAALARIYPTDAAEIRLPCSERELATLELATLPNGPAVTLRAKDGRQWQATVDRLEGTFDPRTRQLGLIARIETPFAADNPLHVGQYLEATVAGRTVEAVYEIPREAIRPGNQLILVDAEKRLRRATIEPLWADQQHVLTQTEIPAGHRLVLTALSVATEGSVVVVKGEEPPPRPEPPASGEGSGSKSGKRGRP